MELCSRCPSGRHVGWCVARWEGCGDACRLLTAPGMRHAVVEAIAWGDHPTPDNVEAFQGLIRMVNHTGSCLPMVPYPEGARLSLGPLASEAAVPTVVATTVGPVVAVVIPAHNYGCFLGECLDSVLAQTVAPTDVIVVDDASTDGTAAVVAAYGSRGVRYLRVDHHDVHRTRMAGVQASLADTFVFLDADDRIPPTFIERCLERITHRKVGIVYSGLRRFGSNDVPFDPPDFDADALERSNYISADSMVTRDALELSGVIEADAPNQPWADWWMWRQIVRCGFTGVRADTHADYRQHDTSMMAQTPQPSYGERAGLSSETITIFTPLSGRTDCWPRYAGWLDRQEWPHRQCRIVLCDTSQDEAFHRLVRGWVAGCPYDVHLYRQGVGPQGLADLDRTTAADAVTLACRRFYSRGLRSLNTPYVLVVEDDIIPPDDVIQRLFKGFGEDVGLVSAHYRSRHHQGYVAWDGAGIPIHPGGHGTIDVGGTGFGCLLARSHLFRDETFCFDRGAAPQDRYYDVGFSRVVVAEGPLRWLLDLSCPAEHLSAPPLPPQMGPRRFTPEEQQLLMDAERCPHRVIPDCNCQGMQCGDRGRRPGQRLTSILDCLPCMVEWSASQASAGE